MVDAFHGNTYSTAKGIKTRKFETILAEAKTVRQMVEEEGLKLAGLHMEASSFAVTEVVDSEITEDDLEKNYTSICDPRTNMYQTLELIRSFYR